jgi:hypothetical protein
MKKCNTFRSGKRPVLISVNGEKANRAPRMDRLDERGFGKPFYWGMAVAIKLIEDAGTYHTKISLFSKVYHINFTNYINLNNFANCKLSKWVCCIHNVIGWHPFAFAAVIRR